MNSTGIIRRVDELGRVVIPIDIRMKLGIVEKDPLEIFIDDTSIVLKKYEQKCIFCGNTKKLSSYENKILCKKCINNISQIGQSSK